MKVTWNQIVRYHQIRQANDNCAPVARTRPDLNALRIAQQDG